MGKGALKEDRRGGGNRLLLLRLYVPSSYVPSFHSNGRSLSTSKIGGHFWADEAEGEGGGFYSSQGRERNGGGRQEKKKLLGGVLSYSPIPVFDLVRRRQLLLLAMARWS